MDLIAPDACTLPAADRPLRVAEFAALFAAARTVATDGPTRATIHVDAPVEGVRDLVRRESGCCSFFRFTVTPDDGVVLGVEVPPSRADALAALLRLVP